jgi:hypothetical protein
MNVLDVLIDVAMLGGALRKRWENEEALTLIDASPAPELWRRGFHELEVARARRLAVGDNGEHPVYRESLAQLGMFPTDDGRMRIYPPPRDTSDAGIASWRRALAEAERGRP